VPGHQLGSGQSSGAFSMSGMAGALPDYLYNTPGQMSQHDQPRFLAGTPSGASNYQQQHQFASQSPMNAPNYANHPSQYGSTYQQGYSVQQSPQSHSGGPSPIYPSYPGGAYFPTQQQQYMYFAGQHGQAVQTQHGSFPSSYGSGFMQQSTDTPSMGSRMPQSGYSSNASLAYPYGSSGSYLRPGMSGKLIFAKVARYL